MKRALSPTRLLLAALLPFGSNVLADPPPLLTTGVEINTSNVRTTLIRSTGKLSSDVTVRIKNTSDRLLEPPLHAIVTFTPAAGSTLTGLTTTELAGGIGQEPYQTFFKDLSSAIGAGVTPGAEASFSFTFARPSSATLSYAVQVRGVRNADPVVSIGGPYSAAQSTPINFDASSSSDPDGDALTYSWDFGDGGTATGAAPQHAFAIPGLYTVRVTATDPRTGSAYRETEVPIVPAGIFALARTRTLDGNGHPLGAVSITQTGPDGTAQGQSDPVSGFTSLGGQPGDHTWTFAKPGHLTAHRKATLSQGTVKVIAFPWLASLNTQRTTLSAINATSVKSPSEKVTLTVPPGAFEQIETVAITDLHGQNLPLPLPHGWSPLAAFHLDMAAAAAENIAASVKLLQSMAATKTLVLARCDTPALNWSAESVFNGNDTDTASATLRKPGSYAIVIADELPAGNPVAAVAGEPLPAGAAAIVAAEVSAIGNVNPASSLASIDPAKVTATATVDFTNGTQPLPSGAWFLAEVEETYDLRDGRALKTPDYDATFYAYQTPGDALTPTATATFPLRPRVLFSPAELSEANIKVQVHALNPFSGGILTAEGGFLTLPGIKVSAPAGAVPGPSAAEARLLSITSLNRFLGSFVALSAFELNLPRLTNDAALTLTLTNKFTPDMNFVLARCVGTGSESGLQPVLRMVSDAQGVVTSIEPASGPRLPGITGSGQYVLVQLTEAEALITGLVRRIGGALLAEGIVRVAGEPWLSLTNNAGAFFTLAKPGNRTVSGTDPADGNSGEAIATLADASAHADVEIQTAPTGPKVIATTPAAGESRASLVAPITIEFSEPIQPATFAASGLRLRDVAANIDVPGSVTLELSNRRAGFFPINPLTFATDYEIIVSSAIRDLQNLPIEGTLTFAFKTQPSDARPAGAQLVIYEPDAENIPQAILDDLVGYDPEANLSMVVAQGSVGTADPEVPVILVNETTGETATVLSKPDGSFANFVRGDEADFVSAVFVNLNGTRIEVPATKQLFDDGRIGLYRHGGILEASNSSPGDVQVIIEPHAIERRTVFKLELLSLLALDQLLSGTAPAPENKLLGGLKVEAQGDALKEPADVSFAVAQADLGLPPDVNPADVAFALTSVEEVEGKKVFNVLDKMEYANGKLDTHSPPFAGMILGASLAIVRLGNGGKAVVTGSVSADKEDGDRFYAVPGATVFVRPDFTNTGLDPQNVLQAGSVVGTTDYYGRFNLLAPTGLNFADASFGMSVVAVSNRFPLQVAMGPVVQDSLAGGGGQALLFSGVAHVSFGKVATPATAPDKLPPRIAVTVPKDRPATDTDFFVRVLATDEQSPVPSIGLKVKSIAAQPAMLVASVTLTQESSLATGSTSRLAVYKLRSPQQAEIELEATALDSVGHLATYTLNLPVGGTRPPLTSPDPDPNDVLGPRVTKTIPAVDESDFSIHRPIILTFDEPLDPGFLSRIFTSVTMRPDAGVPTATLSTAANELTLQYPELKASTDYSLTLTNQIVDRRDNPHDQDPSTSLVELFRLPFKTRPEARTTLPDMQNGAGVVGNGQILASIDRGSGGKGPAKLRVYRMSSVVTAATVLAERNLPPYPRDIVFIPDYDYAIRLSSGTLETRQHTDLVAVVGGTTGGAAAEDATQTGQWIRVFDITEPSNPRQIGTCQLNRSPDSAATKLAWSPPHLGFLDFRTADFGVNLINLQWLLLAQGPDPYVGGTLPFFGLDFHQDGDFVDAVVDKLPASSNAQPVVDLVNGGLVATYNDNGSATKPIYDFSMAFGGKLVGAVGRRLGADPGGYYSTIAQGGSQVEDYRAMVQFPLVPQRVTLLVGAGVEISGEMQPKNLALVSAGKENTVTVIDITDVINPVVLRDIVFPIGAGAPRSIQLAANGLLVVSCMNDVFFLQVSKLALPTPLGASLHPSVLFTLKGAGTGSRSFYSDGFDEFACSQGSRNLAISSDQGGYNLDIGRPGTLSKLGALVPDAQEEEPSNCILLVNEDFDGVETSPPPANSIADKDRTARHDFDDDLVSLHFPRIPPVAEGGAAVRLKLSITVQPLASAESQSTGRIALIGADGTEIKRTTNSETTLTFESKAPDPDQVPIDNGEIPMDTSLFEALNQGDGHLFIDSTRPSEKVQAKVELFDRHDKVVGSDLVSFAVVKATITRIWSDQFHAGRRSNSLPGNAGTAEQNPPATNGYILMGNRDDNLTYAGGELSLIPNSSAIRNKFLLRLATAPLSETEQRTITHSNGTTVIEPGGSQSHVYGLSSHGQGLEFSIVADEEAIPRSSWESTTLTALRHMPFLPPTQFGNCPPFLERFVVGGIDQNANELLDPHEACLALNIPNSAQDSGTGFHRGGLAATRMAGSSVIKYAKAHLKVVPRAVFNSNQVFFVGVTSAVSVFNVVLESFSSLLTSVPEEYMYARHASAFATGTMPLSIFSPTRDGDREIKDFQRATRVAVSPTNTVLAGPEIISAPCMNHGVGEYDSQGVTKVPAYRYSVGSIQSLKVVKTAPFRLALVQNMANDAAFIAAVRLAAATAASQSQTSFSVPFQRTTEQMPIPNDFKGLVVSNPGDDALDLFAGIGGFRIGAVNCNVHFVIQLDSGQPYIPGQTECRIFHLDGNVELNDLYDWELGVNPGMALMQAGHGVYGDGGKAFLTIIPYQGIVPISNNVLDPRFEAIQFGVK